MQLFRILLLASVIAVTCGFRLGSPGEDDLCVNPCTGTGLFIVQGCEWARRRKIGIAMWTTKRTRRQQIRQFCSSCPNPTSCLPTFMQ